MNLTSEQLLVNYRQAVDDYNELTSEYKELQRELKLLWDSIIEVDMSVADHDRISKIVAELSQVKPWSA